jgi:hypothetical protein
LFLYSPAFPANLLYRASVLDKANYPISMEHHLFEKIDPIRVIICRQCKHAVWPREVKKHLTGKKHRLRQAEARSIHEAIEHWDGLEHDPDQLTLPNIIDEPIPGLGPDSFSNGVVIELSLQKKNQVV